MNTFKDNLIQKIKAGEISMKPRWQFILKAILLGLGTVITAILAIYLLSFVMFALRASGVGVAPLYGWRGLILFITGSPWILILFVGLAMLILYLLVTRYSFSYKKPLIYSLLLVVLLVTAASSLIHRSMLHDRMQQFMQDRHIPALTPLYRGYSHRQPPGIITGIIASTTTDTILILTPQGQTVPVQITPHTKLPPNYTSFKKPVVVIGTQEGATITAIGIRPVQRNLHQKRIP